MAALLEKAPDRRLGPAVDVARVLEAAPFQIAQLVALVLFIVLGIAADKRFRFAAGTS